MDWVGIGRVVASVRLPAGRGVARVCLVGMALVAMLLVTAPTESRADAPTLSVGTYSASPGDAVNGCVNLSDGTGLMGYDIKITFSQPPLAATSVTRGSLTPAGWSFTTAIASGQVRVIAFGFAPIASGSGCLFNVNLNTAGAEPCSVQALLLATHQLSDPTGNPLPHTAVDGQIEFEGDPTADFGATPRSGCAPLLVGFTDQSAGEPTSWSWSFGDGGSSTEQNPSHQYEQEGTYSVSLTVQSACGQDTEAKLDYITVSGVAPTADFSATPRSGCAPLLVGFTDQSAGEPTSWLWSFGDGGSSTEQHPSYQYQAEGSYTVTLTVSNACGLDSDTKVAYVTVIGMDFLVGDSAPLLGDQNSDGDSYDVGEFGDDDLTQPDVANTSAAWADPSVQPPSISDLFDATDAYPQDTVEVRGGDGIISWGDLITTHDRSVDPGLPRPRRCARPAPLGVSPKEAAGNPVEPVAEAAVLSLADATAPPAGTAQVSVTLQSGTQTADRFGFSVVLSPAPGTGSTASIIGFEKDSSLPDPDVADISPDGLRLVVSWLTPLAEPLTGSVHLGDIVVQITAGAACTDAWLAHLAAVGTSLGDWEIEPQAQPGPDALVSVVCDYHDIAITWLRAPARRRAGHNGRVTAVISNLTPLPEQVVVRFCGDGLEEQSGQVTIAGLRSVRVTVTRAFTPSDVPAVTLSVEASLPADANPADNQACATVQVW